MFGLTDPAHWSFEKVFTVEVVKNYCWMVQSGTVRMKTLRDSNNPDTSCSLQVCFPCDPVLCPSPHIQYQYLSTEESLAYQGTHLFLECLHVCFRHSSPRLGSLKTLSLPQGAHIPLQEGGMETRTVRVSRKEGNALNCLWDRRHFLL